MLTCATANAAACHFRLQRLTGGKKNPSESTYLFIIDYQTFQPDSPIMLYASVGTTDVGAVDGVGIS